MNTSATAYASIHEELTESLKNYFAFSRLERAVVGVSGGIDSALTLKIAVDALGAKKVTGISMPETGLSSEEHIKDAASLCYKLGVDFISFPINPLLKSFEKIPWNSNVIARRNLKARARMMILYHYANSHNALVLGTSNRSEILLGYGTKFGDFAADIEVIGDLFKDEVYALAEYLQLPRTFIEKAPTAELYPGQTDANEIGANYQELDPILKKIDFEASDLGEKAMLAGDLNPTLVAKVLDRVKKNKHKSAPAPIIHINRPKK